MFTFVYRWLYKENLPQSSEDNPNGGIEDNHQNNPSEDNINQNNPNKDNSDQNNPSDEDIIDQNNLNANVVKENILDEVSSLRAVLDLKNEEIRKLRQNLLLKEAFDELGEKLEKFQAMVEDLEAKLEKCEVERNELRVESHRLKEEQSKVQNIVNNLKFENDQLSWKLETCKSNHLSVAI